MNILIVNCFNNHHKGIIAFSSTQILIRKLFEDQKLLIDNHCQFYIRSLSDLSDFIYEPNSNHQQKDALKNFNGIDMVIHYIFNIYLGFIWCLLNMYLLFIWYLFNIYLLFWQVFVVGQQKLTPWSQESKQLLILLRMCLEK